MEIKSIEAVNITGRDTGKKIISNRAKITHTWYYSGHRIASTKLLDLLHEATDPDHSNPNNMYHIMHIWFKLNCG
jgi:cAMP phosphodiesterase